MDLDLLKKNILTFNNANCHGDLTLSNIILCNKQKKIILIDRFVDSTLAYQHFGMGIDAKLINMINKFLLKNIIIWRIWNYVKF